MKLYHLNRIPLLLFLVVFSTEFVPAQEKITTAVKRNDLEEQLAKAGSNRAELERALDQVESEFRSSMVFLIKNMPSKDLTSIPADLLLENVRIAHRARTELPWGSSIPDDIFLNDVLPYANVDESREAWRKELYELSLPIVKDCKSPAEAAQALNRHLFPKVGVKYSTARKRANQSPSESMEQGLASCTGLSILLTDACRSVCVPARLAGIPSWPNKRGNHTWVEIWDQDWHFTGAAEPNPKGLNRTWFQNDAALAQKDSRLNAIYAISYRKTNTTFPAVWSRDPANPIYAVNVTDRYAKDQTPAKNTVNVMIRVWNQNRTERVVADVTLIDGKSKKTGKSRSNTADMNDMLSFAVRPNAEYVLEVGFDQLKMQQRLKIVGEPNQVFDIQFSREKRPVATAWDKHDDVLQKYFSSTDAVAEFPESLQKEYRKDAEGTRKKIWHSFLKSELGQSAKSNFEQNRVTFDKHESPYTVKKVGKRPANGWPLFIALHGGGGAPARVNDSQWRHMQIYYRDQKSVEGYKYLALRAPNNTWNGFYDDYVYPLIENLITQMVVHGDVDPNRVFVMGYSHGGYGAFAIGPKIPYRFAAVHSSAAAPTDGQTSAKTLRNTRFTFMVGEKDTAYGRRERCEKFSKLIDELKAKNPNHYPVEFLYKPGYGHGGLPDRDMIVNMYDAVRNPTPKHLSWEQTDSVVDHFYWLSNEAPARHKEIDAAIDGNDIAVTTKDVAKFTVWLDQRLIDVSKPVVIDCNGNMTTVNYQPDVAAYCESLRKLRDPNLAYDFKVTLEGSADE